MNAESHGIDVQTSADTVTLSVYVQPRASAAAFAGIHDRSLKIKLTAPPADGAANKQCCQLLAKTLSVPKTSVEITSGHTNRHKRIRIHLGPGYEKTAIKNLVAQIRSLSS